MKLFLPFNNQYIKYFDQTSVRCSNEVKGSFLTKELLRF
jgi:hypothetical protein